MIGRRFANPFKEDSAQARRRDLEDCGFEFQCQKKFSLKYLLQCGCMIIWLLIMYIRHKRDTIYSVLTVMCVCGRYYKGFLKYFQEQAVYLALDLACYKNRSIFILRK